MLIEPLHVTVLSPEIFKLLVLGESQENRVLDSNAERMFKTL